MMKHDDFRKGGKVSVWVGNFASDLELDDYMNLERTFEKDFCFELNERDMPEATVKREPVPISKLVSSFSAAISYAEPVNQLAREKGIDRATTMVVFLNFEYQPELAKPKPNAPLRFLGAVNFSSDL